MEGTWLLKAVTEHQTTRLILSAEEERTASAFTLFSRLEDPAFFVCQMSAYTDVITLIIIQGLGHLSNQQISSLDSKKKKKKVQPGARRSSSSKIPRTRNLSKVETACNIPPASPLTRRHHGGVGGSGEVM